MSKEGIGYYKKSIRDALMRGTSVIADRIMDEAAKDRYLLTDEDFKELERWFKGVIRKYPNLPAVVELKRLLE